MLEDLKDREEKEKLVRRNSLCCEKYSRLPQFQESKS